MFPGINQDDRPCDRFIPTNLDRFEKRHSLRPFSPPPARAVPQGRCQLSRPLDITDIVSETCQAGTGSFKTSDTAKNDIWPGRGQRSCGRTGLLFPNAILIAIRGGIFRHLIVSQT